MTEECVQHSELLELINRLVEWCNSLLRFISDKLGEEAIGEAMERLVNEVYKQRFEGMKSIKYDELVNYFYKLFKERNYVFDVIRRDEETTFIITYCSTGGRLVEKGIAAVTNQAWPWSFNKAGVPYYCVHAYFFNKLWKELGIPVKIEFGKPCKYIIHKV